MESLVYIPKPKKTLNPKTLKTMGIMVYIPDYGGHGRISIINRSRAASLRELQSKLLQVWRLSSMIGWMMEILYYP